MRATGTWVQLEVKRAAGAEAWYIVRYRGGAFKVPGDVTLAEAVRGVQEHWTMAPKDVEHAWGTVRVPLPDYLRDQATLGALRREGEVAEHQAVTDAGLSPLCAPGPPQASRRPSGGEGRTEPPRRAPGRREGNTTV